MKKHTFYSMVREEGVVIAKRQQGYTDGTYNYYRKNYTWFAIHPLNGLSICTGTTRKEAAEFAHTPRMAEKIAAAVERGQRFCEKFAALVEKAEQGAA